MTDFLQVLAVGIGDGAIYAMLGLGLVVVFRATGLLNFAAGRAGDVLDLHRVDDLGPRAFPCCWRCWAAWWAAS